LNTNLGRTPYVKVYVNVDEIMDRARDYVDERSPATTVFEGSATSDPVAVEAWTGSLRRAIEFFAGLDNARFRFVTKYTDVGGLLGLPHQGKTEVRFSVNCNYALEKFETGTPRLQHRLKAAREIAKAGYPLGFLVGPIFVFEGWQEEYANLLRTVRDHLPEDVQVTFELITHRFTARAKKIIKEVYPGTEVPLGEEERRFKYGQFGYGKYVYPDNVMDEIREFFESQIEAVLPHAEILYIV
jgi:spore photoproduct lyase